MISIDYILFIGSVVAIYGMIALALNLQLGHGGLINFGVVAYVGLGAYVYALITGTAGLPWVAGLAVAILAGVLAGYLSVTAFIDLRREYLAIVALALGELFRYIYTNEAWLTNGVQGIVGLDRPIKDISLGLGISYEVTWGIICLVSLVIVYFLIERVAKSPFGRLLRAISSDEKVCESIGRDVGSVRKKTWILGSVIFSLAGAFFAIYTNSAFPDFFNIGMTFYVWTIVIVGGLGSGRGVMLASFIIVPFEEFTNYLIASTGMYSLSSIRGVFYGIMIILVLRFKPQGLLGKKRIE